MSTKTHKTLYLCYFSLREPLVQTQVLPYLREIKKIEGLKISLLTFEPNPKQNWTKEEILTEQKKLANENIEWHFLTYHKRPSATATVYDVLNGVRFIAKLNRKEKIDILHARVHIPVLMAMFASKVTKSKIIFDLRGLMAEEYADAGIWQENSKAFRFIKFIEKKGIEKSSQIVVLTNQMREFLIENKLKEKKNIEVIPCCVDFLRIESTVFKKKRSRFELIYAGSVTGLYLLREMGEFFLELKKYKPQAFFRILTSSTPETVQATFDKLGIKGDDYTVAKISPNEVPKFLKQAHLGISFRSPTFSQIAASPTKIPEYLACGLPIITNTGIGDMDRLVKENEVGVLVKEFADKAFSKALKKIFILLDKEKISEKCFQTSLDNFDLENVGGKSYRKVYNKIFEL